MTFSKPEWLTLIDTMSETYATIRGLEKTLNVNLETNGVTQLFDLCLDMLMDCFFTEEQVTEYSQTHYFRYNSTDNNTEEDKFKFDYETVTEAILYWTCTTDFGHNQELVKRMMVVTDKDNKIVRQYDCYTSEDLYDLIVAYLNRDKEDPTWSYSLYFSTIDRDEKWDHNS